MRFLFDQWRIAMPAVIVVAVALAALKSTTRSTLTYYDEGVYYYQSVLLTRGFTPYTDYFVPQPPGILLIGDASHSLGAGLTGVRIVIWLLGLVAFYQTYRLTKYAAEKLGCEDAKLAGITATAFVALSDRFAYVLTEGSTYMPALCLSLASLQILIGNLRYRFAVAGAIIAFSTLFRIQTVTLVPCIFLSIILIRGIRSGIIYAIDFCIFFCLLVAIMHGTLAAMLPHYIDAAFRFQVQRTRMGFGPRMSTFLALVGEIQVGFGLLAVACLTASRMAPLRAFAVCTLLLVALTTFTGNVLYPTYYVFALPFLAAAAALAVEGIKISFVCGAMANSLAVTFALICTGLQLKSEFHDQWRQSPIHESFIEQIRNDPGKVLLAHDGRIAVLAGKEMVADYYSTDPNALYQLSGDHFTAWLHRTLPQADAIAITPIFLAWLTAEDARLLSGSGKPIFFDSTATQEQFQSLARPR